MITTKTNKQTTEMDYAQNKRVYIWFSFKAINKV